MNDETGVIIEGLDEILPLANDSMYETFPVMQADRGLRFWRSRASEVRHLERTFVSNHIMSSAR